MASCYVLLRPGSLGLGGQRLWWREVIVMTMTMVMFAGKCFSDETPMIAEDCVVYPIKNGSSSPFAIFEENLTLGLLPDTDQDSSIELSFLVETNEGNENNFSVTSVMQEMCFKDGQPGTTEEKMLSVSRRQWKHISFSLSNGTVSIDAPDPEDACPNISLPDGNTSLKITATDHPTNVVFNCHNGCRVYPSSAFSKHKFEEDTILFGKRATEDASAALTIYNYETDCSSDCDSDKVDEIPIKSPDISNTWEPITFNVGYLQTNKTVRFAELKVGKETKWNRIITDGIYPVTTLVLRTSEGMAWAEGCRPPQYEQPEGITYTTAIPELPPQGCQDCCPSTVDHNRRTIISKPLERCDTIAVWLNCVLVLIIFLETMTIFILLKKRSKATITSSLRTITSKINEISSMLSVTSAPVSSQGLTSSSRNLLSESNMGGPSTSAAPPMPSSGSPPSPPTRLPPQGFSSEDDMYCDASELLVFKKRDSPTHASSLHDLTLARTPNDKRSLFSKPPAGDDNTDQEARRKMRDTESGNGHGLTRHESLNSLYAEIKK